MEAAASMIGLIAVGAKVYSVLHQFISNCADAPLVALSTCDEVRDFGYAISKLQPYVEGKTPIKLLGASMTDVDQLSLTLASCVITFSRLEKVMDRLLPRNQAAFSTFDRLKWSLAEDNVTQLVTRLQQHKASLTLLLTIWLRCTSRFLWDTRH